MPSYPNIHNLRLGKCCIDTINDINKRLKLGNVLSVGIGAGVWCNIFGPSPATINTIVSVSQTDYTTLNLIVQSTSSIRALAREAVLRLCQVEQIKHGNNYALSQFWEGMSNVFSI